MNKKGFDIWMNSIDNQYLEEAAKIPKRSRRYRYLALAAAACLFFASTGLLYRYTIQQNNSPDDTITREYFAKGGADYTVLSCEATEPTDISGMETADAEPLVWYAGGLEFKLCSTRDTVWTSWYDYTTGTQWCLISDTSSLALLTTAKDMVEELGYHIAVAPENATDITYDAFRLNDLVVAETTFLLDDVRYSYRMAATYEISEDFSDISGTGELYSSHKTSEVGWCPARIYYTENGYGKIIWFDIVPGLLYSLSMETNASEETLLSLAHDLFTPAQDAADW